jgi:hypothetical protein
MTGLGPIPNAELLVDVGEMELHCLLAYEQHSCELSIRMPLGNELQYLELTRRENLRRVGGRLCDRELASEIDRSLVDLSDRKREIVAARSLEDVGRSTGGECGSDGTRRVDVRENDNLESWHACAGFPDTSETADPAGTFVDPDHQELGLVFFDQRNNLFRGVRASRDRETDRWKNSDD